LFESLSLPSICVIKNGRILLDGLTHAVVESDPRKEVRHISQSAKTMGISTIFANSLPQSVGNARTLMLLPPVPPHLKISNVQAVCKTTKLALGLVLLWPKPLLNIFPTFPRSNHASQLSHHQQIVCPTQVLPDKS
jgi:hypothetical protein